MTTETRIAIFCNLAGAVLGWWLGEISHVYLQAHPRIHMAVLSFSVAWTAFLVVRIAQAIKRAIEKRQSNRRLKSWARETWE